MCHVNLYLPKIVLTGGNVVLLYASVYHDVHTVINLSGRFALDRGIEGRLGRDFMQRIEKDGFIDVKDRTGMLKSKIKNFNWVVSIVLNHISFTNFIFFILLLMLLSAIFFIIAWRKENNESLVCLVVMCGFNNYNYKFLPKDRNNSYA